MVAIGKVETKGFEKGVKEVEEAIEDYVNGKTSHGGAAETAGMPYRDFREELRKRGLLSKRKIALTYK